MTIITEDYVSDETFKLLKEKGFDDSCCRFVIESDETYYRGAPTLQMAMKWLRELHNIKVNVFYNNSNYAIEYFEPNTQTGVDESVFIGDGYDKYEDACETAIKYCLEKLI